MRSSIMRVRRYTNMSTVLTGEKSTSPSPRFALGPIAHLAEGSAACVGGDTAVFAVVSSKRNYDSQ